MDEAVRNFVRKRAEYRCEYCGLHEDDDAYTFHVEHMYRIVGLTPSGRATVDVLNMNDLDRINIREALGTPTP